jgi:NADH-quinone oxidoreductase subunit H
MAALAVMPVAEGWNVANINVGVLYIFAISSLGVYGMIMGGWASNSKYPFLSALRSAAQMVSYEVSLGFVIITVLLCAGSLNLSDIVMAQKTRGLATMIGLPWLTILNWYWLPLFPMFVIFFVSALAETNRPPSTSRKRSRSLSPASWWNIPRPPISSSCSANMSPSPPCAR